MKKLFLPLFLLLFTQPFFPQNLNKGEILEKDYFEVITYENVGGLPIIYVNINGKEHRFLFDTGSPFALTQSLMDELNVSRSDRISMWDSGGNSDSLIVFNDANQFKIGNLTFTNASGIFLPASALTECLNLDGIIGSNLLRNSIVRISYPDKTITITNDRERLNLKSKKKYALNLKPTKIQSNPYFWIELKNGKNKRKLELLFDTGMNGLLDVSLRNDKVLKEYQVYEYLVKTKGTKSVGFFGNAPATDEYLIMAPEIKINKAVLKNAKVNTTNATNSRIGAALLEYGIVTLDYPGKKIYFEPFEQEQDAEEKISPVALTVSEGKIIIGVIWDKELEKELSIGDEVLTVDGIDYDTQNVCDFFIHSITVGENDEVHLKVKNKEGIVKDITVRGKNLSEYKN